MTFTLISGFGLDESGQFQEHSFASSIPLCREILLALHEKLRISGVLFRGPFFISLRGFVLQGYLDW